MNILNATVLQLYHVAEWLSQGSHAAIVPLVSLAVAVFVGVLAVAGLLASRDPVKRRLSGEQSPATVEPDAALGRRRPDTAWNQLLGVLEKRVGARSNERRSRLRLRLVQAGYLAPTAWRTYYAVRVILAVGLSLVFLLLAPFISRNTPVEIIMLSGLGLAVAGLYLPSLWVSHRIARRQREVAESFPDALDMLVVCVEAGLGLDAAFTRVGMQIARAHPVLAQQFGLVALELRAGKSREDAMRNLAMRIGLPEVSSFVTLLLQSDSLGSSIAQTLRVHADEMRVKRTLRAEEKAHMLPVKLSIPLVLCILPAMLTVVLLPGIINIIRHVLPALAGS